MFVTQLKLTNVRAVESAELTFKPGLNLIAGINGAGKTTALDSLAECLAGVTRQAYGLRRSSSTDPRRLTTDDINVLADSLSAELEVIIDGEQFSYVHLQSREEVAPNPEGVGRPREQTIDTRSFSRFIDGSPRVNTGRLAAYPIGLFFSTRRAVPSDRVPTKAASADGYQAAFASAFSHRTLQLSEFTAWLRARVALSREASAPVRVLDSFGQAVKRFLPAYSNVHVTDEREPRLLIDKHGIQIPVKQLSDGERGVLALVFDLTRRLALANPRAEDPASVGQGVVLIDEIDLHLHPTWQREIVRRLPETFPNLQFIATTHSPQVLGEVQSDRIQIMGHGQVFSPSYSFGVDSSRILEEIMEAPPRAQEIQNLLDLLSDQVSADDLVRAQSTVEELSGRLGDDDPEVIRARGLIDFLADDE